MVVSFSIDNCVQIFLPSILTISLPVSFPPSPEVKINIEEGVGFARDICHGMTYLHSLEPLIARFDLNPYHVFVSSKPLMS